MVSLIIYLEKRRWGLSYIYPAASITLSEYMKICCNIHLIIYLPSTLQFRNKGLPISTVLTVSLVLVNHGDVTTDTFVSYTIVLNEALESVMCYVIKIRLNPPLFWCLFSQFSSHPSYFRRMFMTSHMTLFSASIESSPKNDVIKYKWPITGQYTD